VTQVAPPGALVDEAAVRLFLSEKLGEDRPVRAERIIAGKSNETFYLYWGDEKWVLRRPPVGPLPPGAHDIMREYRVLSALGGKGARAPRTLVGCNDESVIGAPFYVMEYIDGVSYADHPPPFFAEPEAKRAFGEQMVRTLAEVHAVDWRAAGLEGFGKPQGFVKRNVERRMSQLDSIMVRCRQLPEMVEVHDWLAANIPPEPDEPTLLHGDYGPHNVLFSKEPPPTALAIVDWELSTLGDPLTDLGWLLMVWHEPGDRVESDDQTFGIFDEPGFHSRAELVELYEQISGRQTHNMDYYRVLATWRLAIALEGTYARHVLGVTDNPYFATLEKRVPAMARNCLAIIGGRD
jgi:aminoglycoside phosphotransferase (APT) family kinase protein